MREAFPRRATAHESHSQTDSVSRSGRIIHGNAGGKDCRAFACDICQAIETDFAESREAGQVSEAEGGTRLELDHAGYGSGGAWGPVYDMTAQAWGFFLGNLKTVLEAGQDNRSAALGQITQPAA